MTGKGWSVEEWQAVLAPARYSGDPDADAVVEQFFTDMVEGDAAHAGHLAVALSRHSRAGSTSSATDAVAAFVADDARPEWYDPDLIATAQEVFGSQGPHVMSALYSASLPFDYAGRKGVHVLHLTARLATDTRRRLLETAQFLLHVMSPGGLDSGGRGVHTIRHVRLMHAAVRWMIQHDDRIVLGPADESTPHYDIDGWGVPVCQADLLGTLLSFTQVPFSVFDKMGVGLSASEKHAYLHLFRVVGHHLGIEPALLDIDVEDLPRIVEAIQLNEWGRSDAGIEMTHALIDTTRASLHWPLKNLPATLMREFSGDEVCDLLDVPRAGWTRHLFTPLKLANEVGNVPMRRIALARRANAHLGRRMLGMMLGLSEAGHASFDIPTHLADEWTVRPRASRTAVRRLSRTT